MDYQSFSTNPWIFLSFLVLGLVFTAVIYGAGPLIFLKVRKQPIRKKYILLFSIAYTAIVKIFLMLLDEISGAESVSYSYAAAFLWGFIFYRIVSGKMYTSGRILESGKMEKAKRNLPDEPSTAPASPLSQDNAPSWDAGSGPAQPGEAPSEPAPSSPPKKRLFRKYETYVVCPGCGSLVPKGTRRCDCGYDLAPLFCKASRKILIPLRRCAPYLIAVVFLVGGIASGYYMGKSSMQEELYSVQSQLDKAQKRIDALKTKNSELTAKNIELTQDSTFYKWSLEHNGSSSSATSTGGANARNRNLTIDPADDAKHEQAMEDLRQSIREDDAES